jgi:hypothetical protein
MDALLRSEAILGPGLCFASATGAVTRQRFSALVDKEYPWQCQRLGIAGVCEAAPRRWRRMSLSCFHPTPVRSLFGVTSGGGGCGRSAGMDGKHLQNML